MQNLKELTDARLVTAFAEGNNQAFDLLLERHQERVFNYILNMVKDNDLANDIFQETFVKVITTIKQGRYNEDGKFSAWIGRIAHNAVIDHFRQEKAESAISTDETDYDILNRRELSEETIEDAIIDRSIRQDIRDLIKSLPDEQRQVLVMRYYNNLSFKEIADKTGVSINTALGRMRYAILNLRRVAKKNNIVLTR
ncbi:MAG: sigma-70 family RNA polymerase sigma factor [Muribaculaceae bacterium]|nr:sigma-70 family RNA polymerase sigma factor [Muribaculaceae bacterium]